MFKTILVFINVFIIELVIEPKKLSVHSSRFTDQTGGRTGSRTGNVINIYFIILYIIKN